MFDFLDDDKDEYLDARNLKMGISYIMNKDISDADVLYFQYLRLIQFWKKEEIKIRSSIDNSSFLHVLIMNYLSQ